MFSIWIRAIIPGLTPGKALATYEALLQERVNRGLGKAAVWVLLAGVFAGVMQAFLTFASGILQGLDFGTLLLASLTQVVRVPISILSEFLVGTVVLLIVAKVLGGKGNLNDQSYLLAAIQAPMTILFAIATLGVAIFAFVLAMLGITPDFASLLVFPLAIYVCWLVVVALRAPHRFSAIRAILTLVLASIVLSRVSPLIT